MISGRSLRSWSHRSPREAIGANGPPSPRLAPGGFYEKGTGSERSEVPVPFSNPKAPGIRVREGWPVPIEPA